MLPFCFSGSSYFWGELFIGRRTWREHLRKQLIALQKRTSGCVAEAFAKTLHNCRNF
jgi:hypothetical protein